MIYSGYRIYDYYNQRSESNKKYTEVSDKVNEIRKQTTSNTEEILSGEIISENYTPIDYKGIIRALKEQNEDVIAYLDIQDTITSYPVVQSSDNDYYLYKDLDENYSIQGTPFLDYENTSDLSDRNSIVYAHTMYTGDEMFATLNKYFLNQEYVDSSPKTFTLTTEEGIYHYRIFAIHIVKYDDPYRHIGMTDDEFIKYLKEKQETSFVDFKYEGDFTVDDRIVTLSTCTDERGNKVDRTAMIGILEKIETNDKAGENSFNR